MTGEDAKHRILEYLSGGDHTSHEISETLMLSDRKVRFALSELAQANLVYRNGNKYSLNKVEKPTKKKSKKKAIEHHVPSILIIRVIFAIVAVTLSLVSVRNTSNFLLESYPPFWAFTMSVTMSLFMLADSAAVVLFWMRKQYIVTFILAILWALVTFISMSSTVIGMFNKNKDAFIEKTTITMIDNDIERKYNSLVKQLTDIDRLIKNKQESLDRYNKLISTYDTVEKRDSNRKDYNNLAWAISDAESFIKKQNDNKKDINDRLLALVDSKPTEVVAPDFYEIMGGIFGIAPALIQFIIASCIAVMVDILSPVASSMSLFLRRRENE